MRARAAETRLALSLLQIGIRAGMPENDQRRDDRHLALAGRAVVLIHVENCFKQCPQILLVKPGLLRQICADEAVRLIQAIRNQLLAPHRAQRIFRLLGLPRLIVRSRFRILDFDGVCHAGDRDIERLDRVKRARKAQLHRAAHLPRIGAGGHDRAKGAHVVKQLTGLAATGVNGIFALGGKLHARKLLGAGDAGVDVAGAAHQHLHPIRIRIGGLNIVADPALDRPVGDITVQILRIGARAVSHIGVAVRVSVAALNVEQEFVTIFDSHGTSLLMLLCWMC